MRIAFLDRCFPTESDAGPSAYSARITRLLKDAGHEPEVFIRSARCTQIEVLDFYGIRVERVPSLCGWPIEAVCALERLSPALRFVDLAYELAGAFALAKRLRVRHRENPFDVVHCSDFGATALFVSKSPEWRVVTRCCWSRELFTRAEQRPWRLEDQLLMFLERLATARSDLVYAPSRFLVEHLRKVDGIAAAVVRPPAYLEREAVIPVDGVPPRYLLHFGLIGNRKGSDLIARALPLAWQEEPDLTMVWAGSENYGEPHIERYRLLWGDRASQVIWLGQVRKGSMYGLISRATASVLPSRSDNLPNTVIESTLLGVPVIGSRGASIDELVEPGVNGALVDIGDVEGLANAMTRAWRGDISFRSLPPAFEEMRPTRAARSLLTLIGAGSSEPAPADRDGDTSRSGFRYIAAVPSPVLKALHPASAAAGVAFNLQRDGRSALAVECENAGMFTSIFFGGVPLETTCGGSSLLSGLVPPELCRRPSRIEIQLRDEIAGASNTMEFRIEG
jgi:glycosyltransferase involved in cell wall biosynthesis